MSKHEAAVAQLQDALRKTGKLINNVKGVPAASAAPHAEAAVTSLAAAQRALADAILGLGGKVPPELRPAPAASSEAAGTGEKAAADEKKAPAKKPAAKPAAKKKPAPRKR